MSADFDFIQPATLSEALEILADSSRRNLLLAGGTDVVPGLRQGAKRFAETGRLVDIHRLPELRDIRQTKEGWSIGAAAAFSQILSHPEIRAHYPLLTKAVSTIGSLQIRNRATIGGNFCNNAPCADSVPPLLVYDTRLVIRSRDGQRQVSLPEFLTAPYRTALQPQELVTEIRLPHFPESYRGDFVKLGRRRGVAISRITLAVLAQKDGPRLKDARIAAGAVTPIGLRFPEPEQWISRQEISEETLQSLAQQLGEQILTRTGLRWSSDYKLPVTQQLFYQMLHKLYL